MHRTDLANQVDGSELLAQTNSILRYLAKLGGIYPSDPLLAAKVDAALDHEIDTFMAPSVATYPARYGVGMDDAQKVGFPDAFTVQCLVLRWAMPLPGSNAWHRGEGGNTLHCVHSKRCWLGSYVWC